MKCEISVLSGLKRKLNIELSVEQVQNSLEESCKKKQKTTNLPGFRKGKVPLSHIRSLYREDLKKDTTLNLINQFYFKAIEREGIRPAGPPKITLKSPIVEDKTFNFTVEVEIQPEINIDKDFKLRLSKPAVEVTGEEVDQAVKNIRLSSAVYEPITDQRGVQLGDIAEVKIKELKNPIGLSKTPMLLEIKKESNMELEGLTEGILNMRPGEEKSLTARLSEKHPDKTRAGKLIELQVTLLTIKKRILPNMNEEFFKKLKCKDMPELKKVVRMGLQREKQNKAYNALKESALKQLVQKHPVDLLPESIMEEQKLSIISSVTDRLKGAGFDEKDIEQYKKKHQADFQEEARSMVHSSYLIYALADKLNITADPREVRLFWQNTHPGKTPSEEEHQRVESFLVREKTLEHLINTAVLS